MSARRIAVLGAGAAADALASLLATSGAQVVREDPAGCALVVVAEPEGLAATRARVATLSAELPAAVLAITAPALPVTLVAAAAADPGLVVGLQLPRPEEEQGVAEVVAGARSTADAVALVAGTAAATGRAVLMAADAPGSVLDRCDRAFAAEALELLRDGTATVAQVDRIARAAGFPAGPFERQDARGLGVCLADAEAAHRHAYGEPRWRPSPLAAQAVAAGRLGRATGQGWYAWAEGRPLRPEDPPSPAFGGGARRLVVLSGDLALAHELRALAEEADWRVEEEGDGDVPWLVVSCGPVEEEPLVAPQGGPEVVLCAAGPLHALDPGGNAAGFHALPPLMDGGLVELTRGTTTTALAADRAEAFFGSLGLATAWVGDAPGLVLGRLVAQLVNEAARVLGEGLVQGPQGLDEALELGPGHPRGPLSWADEIGLDHVLLLLDALRAAHGDRFLAAPTLRRLVDDGLLGMATAHGFHEYEEADEDG